MQFDIYKNMELSTQDDLYFLKLFSEYDTSPIEDNLNIYYENCNSPDLTRIREKYNFSKIDERNDEIKYIQYLKRWAAEELSFKGNELGSRRYDKLNCFEIIEKAKEEGYALNCRYISLIFTQILLSVGFKARLISCMSMDLRDTECHWVTEVYINSLKKWIVVDAPLDLFYFDKKGKLLNLIEMRRLICREDQIKVISINKEYILFVQQYWRKNIFRFKFLLENKYNMLACENKTFLILNPKNYILSNKKLSNLNNDNIILQHYYNYKYFWEEE